MTERLSTKPNKLTRAGLAAAIGGTAMFMLAKSEAAHSDEVKPHTAATSAHPTLLSAHDIKNEVRQLRTQIVEEEQREAARKAARTVAAIPTPASIPTPATAPSPKVTHSSTPTRKPAAVHPPATPPPETEGGGSGTLQEWLLKLRTCESGGNYKANTGNGYYGAYQFSDSTWDHWETGYARADQAPPTIQDATIIENTNASKGGLASQNPGCYKKEHLSQFPPAG